MTFNTIKKIIILILLSVSVYTFQFTQLTNKTTVLVKDANFTTQNRRLTFFSEVSYYYYYYRQLINAPTISEGLKDLSSDKKFTYPDSINVVTKVTLWQEIIGAYLYKTFTPQTTPLTFYVTLTIAIHALLSVILFLSIRFFSGQTLLGLAGAAMYYSISDLSNRVPFQPILRESLGLPTLILSLVLILFYISKPNIKYLIFITLSTFLHGLFWQFSVITNTIKLLILFIFWQFFPNDKKSIRNICLADLTVYVLLVLIYWKNAFYLTPLYLAPLIILLLLTYKNFSSKIGNILTFIFTSGILYLGIKNFIGINASSHLVQFFLDRFFDIKTFHSQLYRTVDAFSNINPGHLLYLTKNLLLPFFGLALLSTFRLYQLKKLKNYELLLLLFCFGYFCLGAVIFRFIIFSLPLMIIYNMIMLSKFTDSSMVDFFPFRRAGSFIKYALLVLIAIIFLINLKSFNNVIPQQPNYMAIDVSNQVRGRIKPTDVIATDMVTSSSLAHLLENPLIIHPQYEYVENRNRVKMFARAYGYTDSSYMYNYFKSLGVNYTILTSGRCFFEAREGTINMREAIHIDFPKQTADTFCSRDFTYSPYFEVFLQNNVYRILRIK